MCLWCLLQLKSKCRSNSKTAADDAYSGDEDVEDDPTNIEDIGLDEVDPQDDAFPPLHTRANSKKKWPTATTTVSVSPSSTITDANLLNVLAARAVDSEALKKKLEEVIGSRDFMQCERLNWGQWLSSCAGQVEAHRWASFRKDSLELMEKYLPTTDHTPPPKAPVPVHL